MMKILLIIFSILLASCNLFAGSVENNTRKLMFEVLDPFMTESVMEGERVISYCPELPCELIQFDDNISLDVAYDFVFLFYFYTTNYTEFNDINYQMPSGYKPVMEFNKNSGTIFKRYGNVCDLPVKRENAKCIVNYLRDKNNIETKLVVEKW